MRADFVANASHELRTPLASLLGFIETLQGPAHDDAEARERFLAVMKTQAERMSRLINDLLSLSRIEVTEHLRPSGRVDLREVIAHVADSLTSLALDSGVNVVLNLPPQPLTVFGERDEPVLYGPGMRWCGLILNGAGSFAQASQMAWNGVRHRSRFR